MPSGLVLISSDDAPTARRRLLLRPGSCGVVKRESLRAGADRGEREPADLEDERLALLCLSTDERLVVVRMSKRTPVAIRSAAKRDGRAATRLTLEGVGDAAAVPLEDCVEFGGADTPYAYRHFRFDRDWRHVVSLDPPGQPPRASRATPRRSLRFTLVREHDPPESFHDVALVTSGDDEGSGSVDVSPTRTATPPRSVSTAWHFLELDAGVPKLVRVGADLRLRRAAGEADASVAFWFDDPRRVFAIALDAFVRVHRAGCRVDVPTDQFAEVRPGDRLELVGEWIEIDPASRVRRSLECSSDPRFAIRDPVASVREPRSEDDGLDVTAHAPRPRTMVAAPRDVRPVTPEERPRSPPGATPRSKKKDEGASTPPPTRRAEFDAGRSLGECYRRLRRRLGRSGDPVRDVNELKRKLLGGRA